LERLGAHLTPRDDANRHLGAQALKGEPRREMSSFSDAALHLALVELDRDAARSPKQGCEPGLRGGRSAGELLTKTIRPRSRACQK